MAILTNKQFLVLAGVALVGGVYVVYKGGKVAESVKEVVTEDLNPANDGNVVNQAFQESWRNITGNPNWTLGGWLYDVTHPDPLTGGATSNGLSKVIY